VSKQKVLITGASRGLGLAIAQALNKDYCLILHASKAENIQHLKEGNYILEADFSNPEEVTTFCKNLKVQHGDDLYAVINNAGITLDKPLLYQPEKDIDKLIQVNLKAPIQIAKTALKIFGLHQKGVIINMSSCVAETGNAFQAVYTATKAGLVAFSKSLAKEVGTIYEHHEIRILSVSPGFIETDMTAAIPQKEQDKYLSNIPLKRFGKAEDVAETVAFLLSSKAAYINGSNININGGIF